MASVYIDNYHVYYSLITGEVKEFEEIKEGDFIIFKGEQIGNYTPVIDDYDTKLQDVVNHIMKSEGFKESGYPVFVKVFNEQNREVTAKS